MSLLNQLKGIKSRAETFWVEKKNEIPTMNKALAHIYGVSASLWFSPQQSALQTSELLSRPLQCHKPISW